MNFIGQYQIDPELCQQLVQDYESKISIERQAHSVRGYSFILSRDMEVDLLTTYELEIYEALKQYQSTYPYSKEGICSYKMDYPFNFQKYYPGHYYSVWHCENNGQKPNSQRHLAFMTYLNTVDDEGETEFLYQNVKIKPKIGLTLIWPAFFTHTHRGIPSKTQVKYISTGWFSYFDTEAFLKKSLDQSDEDFFAKLDEVTQKIS